jgi:rRNA-processing protein FCF1
MKKICLIDTDALIEIIERQKDIQQKIISHIKFSGYEIILPQKVCEEFENNKPSNRKTLKKFLSKWQISKCDIKNNDKEFSLFKIDKGEADAFLQTQKMIQINYNKNIRCKFLFISNDKKALNHFEKNFFKTLSLKQLIESQKLK